MNHQYTHINDKVLAENRFRNSPYIKIKNKARVVSEMLSPGDIHAIRCLYAHDKEIREDKCHADHNLYYDKELHKTYGQYLESIK